MSEYNVHEDALEVLRKSDKITFKTNPLVSDELAQGIILLFERFKKNPKLDSYFTRLSEDPIITAQEVMDQLGNKTQDHIELSLNGVQLDVANAAFIRMIQKTAEVLPQATGNKRKMLDVMNLDYINAGGVTSPVYAEYLRDREQAQ